MSSRARDVFGDVSFSTAGAWSVPLDGRLELMGAGPMGGGKAC
jgi:hypothetical protein